MRFLLITHFWKNIMKPDFTILRRVVLFDGTSLLLLLFGACL